MDKIKTVRPRTESGAQLQLILWTKNMSLNRGVIFYTYHLILPLKNISVPAPLDRIKFFEEAKSLTREHI